MADYRFYEPDGKGGMAEKSTAEMAKVMGISEYDANLIIRGMNLVKTICVVTGSLERPPLVWNVNMPPSLVHFVTECVFEKLQANPAWQLDGFDWSLLYEEDKTTLKYR